MATLVQMRVLIVGVGSRGDVAPYVGLGHRLQESGCRVAIATHARFAAMVSEIGLEWRSVSGDTESLIRSRMQQDSDAAWRQALADFTAEMSEDIAAAAQLGTDVILTPLGQAPICALVAAAFRVPTIGVYLAPSVPTGEFPLPGLTQPDGDDALDIRAANQRLLERTRGIYGDVLPRLGRSLGLPPQAHEGVWDQLASSESPICHGYSPAVIARPADWPDNVDVVGYWWPPDPPGWQPSAQLTDFLAAGPPPVFVGFGSMAVGRGERLGPVILEAIREARVRAVVQAGWAEVSVEGDDVLQIGDTPHNWLFSRVDAAVHHAGAGTSGAALRAGLPTVTVPVMTDQPFWAERIHKLGAGPQPIPFEDLTPSRLAVAIRQALDDPRHRDRATELARLVNEDDGAGAVARRIDQLTQGA
jgi:sterol 3beta-glucosyltransferase